MCVAMPTWSQMDAQTDAVPNHWSKDMKSDFNED